MQSTKLQDEICQLKTEKKVFDAQNKLFEIFINSARSSKREEVLKVTMQSALDIVAKLSGAEKGSLFLMDEDGVITDSILTRDQIDGEKRSALIGKVIDKGLAGWVKKNLEFGLISDAKSDDRWFELPDQTYIVSSALAVPVLRHNVLFGIVTLLHSAPSHFNHVSVDITQKAANQMASAIENAQLYKKLDQTNVSLEKARNDIQIYSKALDDELNQGKNIQKDFLPRQLPNIPNCKIDSYFEAALKLSGDFYDVFKLPNQHLGFVIGDVSGKGVGAALFMALIRSILRIFTGAFGSKLSEEKGETIKDFSPERVLEAVTLTNEYIAEWHGEESMFVTLFFGVVDSVTGKVWYINGGHEPVLVINESGIKTSLKATGPAVGPIQGAAYKIGELSLEQGDLVFAFTDGVTEARSPTREFYTRERVEKLLNNRCIAKRSNVVNFVKKDLFSFIGKAPQSDDITMLSIGWDC